MRTKQQHIEIIKEGIVSVLCKKLSPELVRKIDGYGYGYHISTTAPGPTDPVKESWWQTWLKKLKKLFS